MMVAMMIGVAVGTIVVFAFGFLWPGKDVKDAEKDHGHNREDVPVEIDRTPDNYRR